MLLLLAACALRHPVDIAITRAVVAPNAPDGSSWDGPPVDVEEAAAAAVARMDPPTQILVGLAQSMSAPDPFGSVVFDGVVVPLSMVRDNNEPTWCDGRCIHFGGVKVGKQSVLTVSLLDDDLLDDDIIGTVTLDRKALGRVARKKGAEVRVDTAEASDGAVWWVGVTVAPTVP